MSNTVTGRGKTIDDAVNQALTELGLTRDEVEVNIVEYPENGVFGLFGKKDAVVEVRPMDNPETRATDFLGKLLSKMGLDCQFETRLEENNLFIDITGENMGLIIGKRGQTLDAIQYLTGLAVNRQQKSFVHVILDTENYRAKRKTTLEGVANKTAYKAVCYHKRMALEPMNPSERRIIHATLENHPKVYTFSEGAEPYRHVVVDLK